MGLFSKAPEVEREAAAPEQGVTLYATDDLLERAQKVVQHLGFRGAVGDVVLAVHVILKAYAKLDADAAKGKDA